MDRSAVRFAERPAVDLYRVAVVAKAAQQRVDEVLVSEEVRPLGIVDVGGDDRSVNVRGKGASFPLSATAATIAIVIRKDPTITSRT